MYKLLFAIALSLLFTGCAQQTRGVAPQMQSTSSVTPYSLEALDARYHQGY